MSDVSRADWWFEVMAIQGVRAEILEAALRELFDGGFVKDPIALSLIRRALEASEKRGKRIEEIKP